MADSILIPYSGQRIFTAAGNLASNASITVFDAGTTDLHDIFSDAELTVALSNPTFCDSNGLCPFVYVGTAAYKVLIQESGGATLDTEDDIKAAVDTAAISTTFAKPDTDVSAKADDYTMVEADIATVISVDPLGVTKTVTLISAVAASVPTMENGRGVTIMYVGTTGTVTINTSLSQTITRLGGSTTTMSLSEEGESVTLVSDGANWLATSEVDAATAAILTTRGDMLTRDATTDVRLPVGTTGQFLTSDGTDPSWGAIASASDAVEGVIEIAVQSEMETGTSTALAVTPGRQHFHLGHPKAWVSYDQFGTPAIDEDYAVTSVADDATGRFTITWDTAFTGSRYATVSSSQDPAGFANRNCGGSATKTTTTAQFACDDSSGDNTDAHNFVCGLGDT